MKYFLIACFCAVAEISVGQTLADGYYVTNENDSVRAKIKVPITLFTGFDPERLEFKMKSKLPDSARFQKFTPTEIKAFGFHYKSETFRFMSINLDEHSKGFFQTIYSGNNIGGYLFVKTGYRGSATVTVRVQIPEGENLTLNSRTMSRKSIKQKFISFFKNNDKAETIIQGYNFSLRHLPYSVKTLLQMIAASDVAALQPLTGGQSKS
jgi:hypothetical protein